MRSTREDVNREAWERERRELKATEALIGGLHATRQEYERLQLLTLARRGELVWIDEIESIDLGKVYVVKTLQLDRNEGWVHRSSSVGWFAKLEEARALALAIVRQDSDEDLIAPEHRRDIKIGNSED